MDPHAKSTDSSTHLERDVLIPNPNLQLLPPDDVLLWPLCIVFLHDFTLLDELPDLIHDELSHPHCRGHILAEWRP